LSNILKCVIHCQLHELMRIATTCKANLGNVMFFEVLDKKRIETRQRKIVMGGRRSLWRASRVKSGRWAGGEKKRREKSHARRSFKKFIKVGRNTCAS
jgi:hypothetical protein